LGYGWSSRHPGLPESALSASKRELKLRGRLNLSPEEYGKPFLCTDLFGDFGKLVAHRLIEFFGLDVGDDLVQHANLIVINHTVTLGKPSTLKTQRSHS
jgi:hypothetical protein